MRVKAFVSLEQEVEVDIGPDEIAAAIGEGEHEDNVFLVQRAMNNFATFMNGVPDDLIAKMTPHARSITREYLAKQAARFQEAP